MKNPQAGCKIVIYWKQPLYGTVDHGYLYQTPRMDEDNFMVHIPNPENPGGIDGVPPVWIRLDRLLKNKQIKRIRFTK